MIVELARTDFNRLLHAGELELDAITLRLTNGESSKILHEQPPAPTHAAEVSERRTDARAQLTGEPQFYMRAKFDGVCAAQRSAGPHAFDCTQTIATGEQVLRDAANKKTFCAPCGAMKYPNVPIRR